MSDNRKLITQIFTMVKNIRSTNDIQQKWAPAFRFAKLLSLPFIKMSLN